MEEKDGYVVEDWLLNKTTNRSSAFVLLVYMGNTVNTISLENIPLELVEEEKNIIKELDKKFRFVLIHPRPKLVSHVYRVRFKAYHLAPHSSINFLAVWEYPIQFPFLPTYQLAQISKFNPNATSLSAEQYMPCHSQSNQRSVRILLPYCNNQSFSSQLSLGCLKYALMRPISSSKFLCLCPSDRYGPTCHLNHTRLNKNPCENHRGKCYPNPDNITQDFICICNKAMFGNRCELNSTMVEINLTNFSFVQMPVKFILSSIMS